MAVLAVVEDLLFRSKIEAAAAQLGVPVCVIAAAAALPSAPEGQTWRLVIVELDRERPDTVGLVERLRRALPDVPILGYGSHVDTQLHADALRAGCTTVLPRSAFVQRLPELIIGKLV